MMLTTTNAMTSLRDPVIVPIQDRADLDLVSDVARWVGAFRCTPSMLRELAEVSRELADHIFALGGEGRLEFYSRADGIEVIAMDGRQRRAPTWSGGTPRRLGFGFGFSRGLTKVRQYMDEVELALHESGGLQVRAFRRF